MALQHIRATSFNQLAKSKQVEKSDVLCRIVIYDVHVDDLALLQRHGSSPFVLNPAPAAL
jgi:hypothetical protein